MSRDDPAILASANYLRPEQSLREWADMARRALSEADRRSVASAADLILGNRWEWWGDRTEQ